MSDAVNIGLNMKKRRQELGLTLDDVARKLEVSRQTVSRYETGVISNYTPERIADIASALSTTVSYLYGYIDEKTGPQNTRKRISFLMESEGISSYSLCSISGVDEKTLRRYIEGDYSVNLSREELEHLAAALHTSTAYLIGYVSNPHYFFSDIDRAAFLKNCERIMERTHPELSAKRHLDTHPYKKLFDKPEQLTLNEACLLSDNIGVPFEQLIDGAQHLVSWTTEFERAAMDEHIEVVQEICGSDIGSLSQYENKIFDEQIMPRRIRIVTEYLRDSKPTLVKLMNAAEVADEK